MPSRKLLITVHLYLAAVFTPMILLMATTGTLYLFGIKGKTTYQDVQTVSNVTIDGSSQNLKADVLAVLRQADIEFDFEYVKVKGNKFYTRPTSRDHYLLVQKGNRVEISKGEPDLPAALMELHKGHGPGLFKWLEKLFGIALVLIALSGFWLGLASSAYRGKTLVLSGVGLVLVLGAALF